MKIQNLIVVGFSIAAALFTYADQADKGIVCAVLAVAWALVDDS